MNRSGDRIRSGDWSRNGSMSRHRSWSRSKNRRRSGDRIMSRRSKSGRGELDLTGDWKRSLAVGYLVVDLDLVEDL